MLSRINSDNNLFNRCISTFIGHMVFRCLLQGNFVFILTCFKYFCIWDKTSCYIGNFVQIVKNSNDPVGPLYAGI